MNNVLVKNVIERFFRCSSMIIVLHDNDHFNFIFTLLRNDKLRTVSNILICPPFNKLHSYHKTSEKYYPVEYENLF